MSAFLNRDPKTWTAVVEKCDGDLEACLGVNETLDDAAMTEGLLGKCVLQAQLRSRSKRTKSGAPAAIGPGGGGSAFVGKSNSGDRPLWRARGGPAIGHRRAVSRQGCLGWAISRPEGAKGPCKDEGRR